MVPVIATSTIELSTALRKRIAESCRRDLSKAFVAWLLEEFNQRDELLSIAASAPKREGAGQDFQTVAILGFAAAGGVLSERELAALKKGLSRLAGRSPVVSGVPMPFCADGVGILGIALGTAVIANPEVTGQVAGWAMRFLKRTYEGDHTEDWQRCLFAAADLKMRTSLNLPLPNGTAAADVRLALLAKGLIHYPETQVRQDVARLLNIVQPLPTNVDCERDALCLASLEWVIHREGKVDCRANASSEWTVTNAQDASQEGKHNEIDAIPRKKRGRPTTIADELKQKALAAQGTKARAQILYQCRHPTPQQQRNVSSILNHYRRNSTKS